MKEIKLNGYSAILLRHDEIDIKRWDETVRNSANESPVVYSWVLDIMHPGWNAVVVGDYEGVMPLTTSKVMFSEHLQMPYDLQNFGVFSSDSGIIGLFAEICIELTKIYRLISYSSVVIDKVDFDYSKSKKRRTFLLDLNKTYDVIRASYSHGHKRNVNIFKRSNLTILENKDSIHLLQLKEQMWQGREFLRVPVKIHRRLKALIEESIKRSCGEIYTVLWEGKPVSSAFFLEGKDRSVILHASNEIGKRNKCAFGLIDKYIKRHSEQSMILDFAGSDVDGIADFNRGFGASECIYPMFENERLGYGMRMLKRMRLKHKLHYFLNKF
ncbi:MAG: hypothetical protein MI866_09645 [Bacteroidales bacterium]|nr:hypothetical protein [Bacteroidales bacterium]